MKIFNRTTLRSSRSRGAFSLVEVMIAVAIFSITLTGYLMGLFLLQRQNRIISQREIATRKAIEILELFKNSNYTDVAYSTVGTPRYLRRDSLGAWNTNWKIPLVTAWQTLPVEDVNPGSASDPTILVNKLPDAEWTCTISDVVQGAGPTYTVRRVAVTVRWKMLKGESDAKRMTVAVATDLSPNFTWL